MGRPKHGYEIDGIAVPGVTTIVSRVKSSAGLLPWARTCGQKMGGAIATNAARRILREAGADASLIAQFGEEDVDPNVYHPDHIRDAAAAAGTCMHEMIESWLTTEHGGEGFPSRYTKTFAEGDALLQGIEAYKGWKRWWEQVGYAWELVDSEVMMTSRTHMFGGTCDAVMRTNDGHIVMCDWKSSTSIYSDVLVQLAAYVHLWGECREEKITHAAIVQGTKAGGCSWWLLPVDELAQAWEQFLAGLALYRRDKTLDAILRSAKQAL